jgi:glycine cleavage system aminomethyltransferase T
VTALDFLSPDRARADLGFSPLARSPIDRQARLAGARFEERHGWLVPVELPGEAERLARVGIADLSHLAKFEVRGGAPGAAEGLEAAVWHRLRPDRALVLAPFREAGWLRDRLERAFPLVLDQTAAYAVLALAGPEAPAVLRRLTHLHELPASGDVAHIPAHVLDRESAYWIVFPQEYGRYLWEVAVDAAEPFGGGPVGADALAGGTL